MRRKSKITRVAHDLLNYSRVRWLGWIFNINHTRLITPADHWGDKSRWKFIVSTLMHTPCNNEQTTGSLREYAWSSRNLHHASQTLRTRIQRSCNSARSFFCERDRSTCRNYQRRPVDRKEKTVLIDELIRYHAISPWYFVKKIIRNLLRLAT
jgi:hypothetical protein